MYKRIMVSIDGSNTSTRASRGDPDREASASGSNPVAAHRRHDQLRPPGRIRITAVLYQRAVYAYGQELLEQAQKEAEGEGLHVETRLVELKRASDHIAQVIVDEAKGMSAELLIMGTHGRRGLNHLLLGSVAEGVIRLTSCPVLLIRSE
jgi:nucleotide-binding universal stress UspA family protein